MSNKKIISFEVDNKQLDALEDLLFAEISDSEKKKIVSQAKKLWQSLVEAYDNDNANT